MGCLIFCLNQNKISCFLCRAAITFSLVPKHLFKNMRCHGNGLWNQQLTLFRCRLAPDGAEKLKMIQLFGLKIAPPSRKLSGQAIRRRTERGDRGRFQGWEAEPRGETRAKMFHVCQWAERDAISPRVSCVSTFRAKTWETDLKFIMRTTYVFAILWQISMFL